MVSSCRHEDVSFESSILMEDLSFKHHEIVSMEIRLPEKIDSCWRQQDVSFHKIVKAVEPFVSLPFTLSVRFLIIL